MALKRGVACLLPLLIVLPTNCAPKSRKHDSPHTVYDQKQTGDYNIQLHLKDFQIIALLADDSGAFGDYDYSYDYSDFTVKPSSSATPKPTDTSSSPTIPSLAEKTTTPKPTNHPYPIVSPSTEKPQPQKTEETPTATEKATVSNEIPIITTQNPPKVEEMNNSPGKIKVQIIEAPVGVGIVPGEDLPESNEALPQGEILQLKRCVSGFTRDKRGRCRRVRRPGSGTSQLPYQFSRIASSLASRFRQASAESSLSSSESTEN